MAGLGHLALAAALFVVVHAAPASPSVRAALIGAAGERLYLSLYSAVSLALLVWLVLAFRAAPFVPVWPPPAWGHAIAIPLMLPAVVLVVLGLRGPEPQRLGIRTVVRHPAMWGLALWAAIHIAVNGDAAAILMFGSFGLLALPGAKTAESRWRAKMDAAAWQGFVAATSALPFAAILAGRTRFRLRELHLSDTLIALGTYAMLLVLHGPVIGYDLV